MNSIVFILFAYTFYKPITGRDWRSFGMYSGFIVALFAEMYGFPLTIYLLSGWLTRQFPQVDWLSHDAGHLLEMMFGWRVNPHFGPFHRFAFIIGGSGCSPAPGRCCTALSKLAPSRQHVPTRGCVIRSTWRSS